MIVASATMAFGFCGGVLGETEEEVTLPSEEALEAANEIAAEVEQEKALKEQEQKIEAEKHAKAADMAINEGDYLVAIEELNAAIAADPDNETYQETLREHVLAGLRSGDQHLTPLVTALDVDAAARSLAAAVQQRGKPLLEGDRNHLSHRLAALGLTPREVLAAEGLATLATGLPTIAIYVKEALWTVVVTSQAAAVLSLVWVLERAGSRRP